MTRTVAETEAYATRTMVIVVTAVSCLTLAVAFTIALPLVNHSNASRAREIVHREICEIISAVQSTTTQIKDPVVVQTVNSLPQRLGC